MEKKIKNKINDYEFTDDWYCDSKICEHYLIKDCLYHRNKELRQRIEKAIEIIESYNLGKYDYSISPIGIIELLQILKGEENGDKNEKKV